MALQLKHYRKQLSKLNEENIFLLPWGGVVCRNCDDLGDLLTFKNIPQYKENDKSLWLLLSLVLFRENVILSTIIIDLSYYILTGRTLPHLLLQWLHSDGICARDAPWANQRSHGRPPMCTFQGCCIFLPKVGGSLEHWGPSGHWYVLQSVL